jgi:hypothetical protein
MIIRTGYISNSSSSSFVIAHDKSLPKVTISIEVDLNKYIESEGTATTMEELKELIDYQWDIDIDNLDKDVSWCEERVKECIKAIKDGKSVSFGSFDSCGDPIEQFLCSEGLESVGSEDIDVISGAGGY